MRRSNCMCIKQGFCLCMSKWDQGQKHRWRLGIQFSRLESEFHAVALLILNMPDLILDRYQPAQTTLPNSMAMYLLGAGGPDKGRPRPNMFRCWEFIFCHSKQVKPPLCAENLQEAVVITWLHQQLHERLGDPAFQTSLSEYRGDGVIGVSAEYGVHQDKQWHPLSSLVDSLRFTHTYDPITPIPRNYGCGLRCPGHWLGKKNLHAGWQ